MSNNLIIITFDSCRYDSFMAADTPNIRRLGEPEKRYSFASWTVPSHHVFMMGVLPHVSPKGVFASEVYRKEFSKWTDRLNIPNVSFKDFVPQLSLPLFLKKNGYRTQALVSMPVLNSATLISSYFDSYKLMESHNDFSKMIDDLQTDTSQPFFCLMNVGETHYPYTLPGESGDHLPRIHGVHGVFKHLDDAVASGTLEDKDDFFDLDAMKILHQKQISNVSYLDTVFKKLYEKVPPNTYIIVTGDHGECFGEDGYFGHGPVMHEKSFEVFLVEGLRK